MSGGSAQEAFVDLVRRHQAILQRIAATCAATRADRADLVQEMILQLWRSFGSFGGQASFTTWMYRVALNTALGVRRRRRGWLSFGHDADRVAAPEPAAVRADEIERLYACIRALPALDRAIALLYLDERSYEEIAEVTGLTRANVSVRLVRLKQQLKSMFDAAERAAEKR